ncbi:zinc finger protein and SCAN domain-containing protein 4, partial [Sigmodon hispidus]
VHGYMQGQEALFSENMSLREVINILKEQQLGSSLSQENARTSLPIFKDMLLAT